MSFFSIQAFAIAAVLISTSTPAFAQYSVQTLKSFGFTNISGINPRWTPIEGTNETNFIKFSVGLFGTTYSGGSYGNGTSYRINTNGQGFETLHHFLGGPTDGANPDGPIFQLNQSLYAGTTRFGGSNNQGTVFTITRSTTNFVHRTIHHFQGGASDGAYPIGALRSATVGGLPGVVGITVNGGQYGFGCIYRVAYDGSGFSVDKFYTGGKDGGFPNSFTTTTIGGGYNEGLLSGLTIPVEFDGIHGSSPVPPTAGGLDGYTHGVTTYGGQYNKGVIYRVRVVTNRLDFVVDHEFQGGEADGEYPLGGLQNPDGSAYGVTPTGGKYNAGTLYVLAVAGAPLFRIIRHFSTLDGQGATPIDAPTRGAFPGVLRDLYGVTSQGGRYDGGTLYVLKAADPEVRRYSNLWHFSQSGGDGLSPATPILAARNGLLYGVTPEGGSANGGTVYRITKAGTNATTLLNFGLADESADGLRPVGGLLEASDGFLYGVTQSGGASNAGSIFLLSKDGTTNAVLKSLASLDGSPPNSALIESRDGLLYGTTAAGGTADLGTIFRLEKSGTNFAVIHQWTGGPDDGALPNGVMEATDGWLYGTTATGGSNDLGIIFKLQRDGGGFTILRHCSSMSGYEPRAGLLEASDGVLYGTTRSGGSGGAGTVFKLNKNGSGFAAIKNFTTSVGGPEYPACTLVEGSDRALYGVSPGGGAIGYGAVFRVLRDGSSSSVIHSFTTLNLGGFGPAAGLARDTDGSLYGVTEQGGDLGKGTLFRLVPQWSNHPPQISNPVGTRIMAWAAQTSFAFASNTFTDPDVNQVLSYTALGQPAGLSFTGTNRTFSGKATTPGDQVVTLVATDNGNPALSAVEKFKMSVVVVPPRLTAPNLSGPAGLNLYATNGQTVVVELSTNLFNWLPFSTNTVLLPPLFLGDPGATGRPQSFYRAVIQP